MLRSSARRCVGLSASAVNSCDVTRLAGRWSLPALKTDMGRRGLPIPGTARSVRNARGDGVGDTAVRAVPSQEEAEVFQHETDDLPALFDGLLAEPRARGRSRDHLALVVDHRSLRGPGQRARAHVREPLDVIACVLGRSSPRSRSCCVSGVRVCPQSGAPSRFRPMALVVEVLHRLRPVPQARGTPCIGFAAITVCS